MKSCSLFFACGALLLLCSCSMMPWAKDAPADKYTAGSPQVSASAPPPQAYKQGGITFKVAADPQLNRYKNSPHALLVCFYQLRDPNAFNQLADDRNSLGKLMECGKFDSSVTYAKRIVVQPGQSLTELRDRAEGTRYIGIAAGYYSSGHEKTTHLAPITTRSTTSVEISLGSTEISAVTVK